MYYVIEVRFIKKPTYSFELSVISHSKKKAEKRVEGCRKDYPDYYEYKIIKCVNENGL